MRGQNFNGGKRHDIQSKLWRPFGRTKALCTIIISFTRKSQPSCLGLNEAHQHYDGDHTSMDGNALGRGLQDPEHKREKYRQYDSYRNQLFKKSGFVKF